MSTRWRQKEKGSVWRPVPTEDVPMVMPGGSAAWRASWSWSTRCVRKGGRRSPKRKAPSHKTSYVPVALFKRSIMPAIADALLGAHVAAGRGRFAIGVLWRLVAIRMWRGGVFIFAAVSSGVSGNVGVGTGHSRPRGRET